jgi:hypothetical protein
MLCRRPETTGNSQEERRRPEPHGGDNSRTRLFLRTVACTVQSQGAELCPEEA